jgi:hypothetical protein
MLSVNKGGRRFQGTRPSGRRYLCSLTLCSGRGGVGGSSQSVAAGQVVVDTGGTSDTVRSSCTMRKSIKVC